MKYPESFLKLIEDFKKFPGIGSKTAERLALFTLSSMDKEDVNLFSTHLVDAKTKISTCPICGVLMESHCGICEDETRSQKAIMVVSDEKDVFILEKNHIFDGLYHVLGGSIDFSRGIQAEDLNIDSLFKRLNGVEEVILSLSGTVEGELTAQYLKELLKRYNLKVSRIAYGIPVGADLSYADDQTLERALLNRQKYE
ncbi:MAG: recombination mediator RecR [Acholeplasma sp.]|jgi:recombination protein RecR|nr:recombination mediator RecR [Acholeplasma sp.]